MLNFSQIWTSLPNDANRPMLIDDNECNWHRAIWPISLTFVIF